MDFDFNTLIDAIARFGLQLIGVILLLFAAWIVARWARRATTKSLAKTRLDETLTKFLANMTGWLILILAVLAVLGIPFPQVDVHLDQV